MYQRVTIFLDKDFDPELWPEALENDGTWWLRIGPDVMIHGSYEQLRRFADRMGAELDRAWGMNLRAKRELLERAEFRP